ncbi:unnamed protein product, partial [Polarella glacialis]
DRWLWARAAVMTRAGAGTIPTEGPGGEASSSEEGPPSSRPLAIVPLVDFANCAADPSARCRLCADGAVEVVTVADMPIGAEVTISYGFQSQEQQLFTFGFSLPESPMEVMAPLPMVLPPQEEAIKGTAGNSYEVRSALLRLLFLERRDELEVSAAFSSALPPLAMLRSAASTGSGRATVQEVAIEADISELLAVANLL